MRIPLAALALPLILAAACGGDSGGAAAPQAPSKAGLLQTLRDMSAAVGAGDLDKALTYMVAIPEVEPARLKQSLATFVEREGVTPANIDTLGRKAKYGPLTEVFPERGKRWAERVKVDPAACYALGAGNAEVAAHWNGERFRLIRVDDLDKIE